MSDRSHHFVDAMFLLLKLFLVTFAFSALRLLLSRYVLTFNFGSSDADAVYSGLLAGLATIVCYTPCFFILRRMIRKYRAKHPSKDYTPKQPDTGALHISDVVHPGRPVQPVQPQPYNRLIRPECQPRPQRVIPKDVPEDAPRHARPLVPSKSRKV